MKILLKILIIVGILIVGTIGIQDILAPQQLEINPDSADVRMKFRMFDPLERLTEPTVAVFKQNDEEKTTVELKELPQGKKAHGAVPDIPAGVYDVYARTPTEEFFVDTFIVEAGHQ